MITWIRSQIGRFLRWRNDTDHLSPVAAEATPHVLKADISERDLLKQSRGLAKTGEGGSF